MADFPLIVVGLLVGLWVCGGSGWVVAGSSLLMSLVFQSGPARLFFFHMNGTTGHLIYHP